MRQTPIAVSRPSGKAGLTVTAEDLTNARASMETGELSDADLERVAGGSTASWVIVTLQTLSAFG